MAYLGNRGEIMSLFGVSLGIAVIATGAALAGKILFDKLSDNEVRRQQKMENEYESYCSDRRSQYYNTVASYDRSYTSRADSYNRSFTEERRKRIEELRERNRPYLDNLRNNLNEQRKNKKADLEKLLEILNQWEGIKNKSQSTMLRMKSIKKSILAIEEACYKLQSYFCYLDRYEHNMDYHFNRNGSIPFPFHLS